MGHAHETVEVRHKEQLAVTFFQQTTAEEVRRALLADHGIRYLFHGPAERKMGDFDPSGVAYLTPAYENPCVVIYLVNP